MTQHGLESESSRSHSDDEKILAEQQTEYTGGRVAAVDPDAHLSPEERTKAVCKDRRLLWKLDLRLIPWLSLLYLISFLDRTNIGNAKIDGLTKDLNLTDGDYLASLSIFFVSYSLAEPITNVLLKKLRPRIFIPMIMLLWGLCMTTMGLVHNYEGLMVARFFLGLTEAGLFPGINYYLSCWYKRSEFGIRAAIFFSAAAVSGSFGGLLAAAIGKMRGVGGKAGWSWIFILEGLLTIVIGIISFWMVHDFPDEAKFLSDEDRARVIYRLKTDKQSSAEHEEFQFSYVWDSLKDWKTWLGMIVYMGCDGPLYAFSLFLPSIVSQLQPGTSIIHSQLLSVPPYVVACFLTIVIGYIADRTGKRGYCNMGVSLIGITGFAMLLGSTSASVRYAGTFLGALGIYPCIANTISWVSNNTEGVYKRGVTLGLVIGWGNLNGVVSSNIFRQKDAKMGYKPGHGVVMAYLTLFLFGGSLTYHLLLRSENNKRMKGKRNAWIEGRTPEEIDRLGDSRPDFLYTL
ncbi:MAG: hypothetical protein M1814_003976 [Vezdaea aestivalis]|nr:MAG: hypothetical protein M1814_003976 [Vezdaea aestivalis]